MKPFEDATLLAEVADLIARYGPETRSRLAALIRDPKQADKLATILETASVRSSRRTRPSSTRRTNRIGMGILKELRRSNSEKHDLIAGLRHELLSASILPTMNHMRQFARMNDISIGKASSRTAAIAPLLRSLSKLPSARIRALHESLIQSETDDRSLERWREVIVKPRPDVPHSKID